MKVAPVLVVAALVAACGSATAPSPGAPATASPSTPATPAGSGPARATGGTIVYSRSNHHEEAQTLFTIAPDGSTKRTVAADYECCARWSTDGRQLLMAGSAPDGRVTVRIANADGSGDRLRPLPTGSLNLGPGSWLPHGWMTFEGWVDGDTTGSGVYIGDANGQSPATRVTTSPDGMHDIPLSASPDGRHVLFVRVVVTGGDTFDDGLLFVTDVAGGAPRALNAPGTSVSSEAFWGDPASWSPDGRQIAFVSFPTGSRDRATLQVVSADGTGRTQIAPTGDPWSGAHWSPDGRWVMSDRNAASGGAELFVVRPDGTAPTAVSAPYGCCGAWSPDGSAIVYLVEREPDTGDLFTSDADGSHPIQLTHEPGHYEWYSWAP